MKGFVVRFLVVVVFVGVVCAYIWSPVGKDLEGENSAENEVSSRHFDREKVEGDVVVPEENPDLLVPEMEKPARLIGPSDIDKMLEQDVLQSQKEGK